jgi:hypothetical protein
MSDADFPLDEKGQHQEHVWWREPHSPAEDFEMATMLFEDVYGIDKSSSWLKNRVLSARHVGEAAKPAKPKPRYPMVGSGDVVTTISGRRTSPAPRLDFTTDRKATSSSKRLDAWLVEEAVAEAEHRDDDFNLVTFSGLSTLSNGDRTNINDYLFVNPVPPPTRSFLRSIAPTEAQVWGAVGTSVPSALAPYGLEIRTRSNTKWRTISKGSSEADTVQILSLHAKGAEGRGQLADFPGLRASGMRSTRRAFDRKASTMWVAYLDVGYQQIRVTSKLRPIWSDI